ncbi:MAG: hypothetical protein RQ743_14300 [Bacteroidales bacterium]|nr:hypothetical protein [Bacteroidales bacterium]
MNDRDGLTDGWEAITDLSINPYGPTNPTNRDSDNDGAIDGGESNVYPSTPIDIDGDGEVGSKEQTDLEGSREEWVREGYWGTLPGDNLYEIN